LVSLQRPPLRSGVFPAAIGAREACLAVAGEHSGEPPPAAAARRLPAAARRLHAAAAV
jgi:hypothetical protein